MKKKISRILSSLSLGFALTTAGCPSSDALDTASTASDALSQALRRYEEGDDCDGKKLRVAWLGTVPQNAFDGAELAGAQASAARMQATVQPFYSNFDPALQLQQCNQAVQSGAFDAVVMIPMDSTGIIPCVTAAKSRRVPVVATQIAIGPDPASVDPQVPGQVGAVLTPVAKFGSELAKLAVSLCGTATCNIVYLAGTLNITIDARAIQELNSVIATHPNMHLVATREVYWDGGLAQAAMQDILSQTRDIQLILTSGDQMTQGAEQAINAANLAVRPKLVGAGVGGYAVEAIRAGRWAGSFVVLPYDEGWLGTRIAIRAARGLRVKDPGIDPVAEKGLPAFMTTENQSLFKKFTPQWPG
jgi:ribose transport system substrate-binding protein